MSDKELITSIKKSISPDLIKELKLIIKDYNKKERLAKKSNASSVKSYICPELLVNFE
jgi:hypothetical protein